MPDVQSLRLVDYKVWNDVSAKLFADGVCVADGSGTFARECFCEGAEVFLDLCRDAVRTTELRQWSQREYELLSAARGIAEVQANAGGAMVTCGRCMPFLKSHKRQRGSFVISRTF